MLGKQAKKVSKWLGKSISTVERANNWLGKSISTVEQTYRKGKRYAIKAADRIGMGDALKSAIAHAEATPYAAYVESGFKQVKAFNQDVKTAINNPATKLGRKGLEYVGQSKTIEANSKPFIPKVSGNLKLQQFHTS